MSWSQAKTLSENQTKTIIATTTHHSARIFSSVENFFMLLQITALMMQYYKLIFTEESGSRPA